MSFKRKYVVIGCGGFIGSHLLDRLLADPEIAVVGWDPDDRKVRHHLDKPNFWLHREYVDEPGTVEVD